MQLSGDQIVEETSDWPEDAVAVLVDRILRANTAKSIRQSIRLGTRRLGAELPI
jgi:hypothetical protein